MSGSPRTNDRDERDPYADERHTDEAYDDRSNEAAKRDSMFGSFSYYPEFVGRWPFGAREAANPETADSEATTVGGEEGGWWDEGLISLLIVAGVVLFLLPEPATSMVGIGLVLLGLFALAVDWLT